MKKSDRLTERNEHGQGIINMQGVNSEEEARARLKAYYLKIIATLTAYEDTGLSPEEVEELKTEIAELREKVEKSV